MLALYTIASSTAHAAKITGIHTTCTYTPNYQAKPGTRLPILISENGEDKMVLATWKPAVKIESGKNASATLDMHSAMNTYPYKHQIRQSRCAILANCFFGLYKDDPYLIRVLGERLFCMAGLCEKRMIKNSHLYSFTLLHINAADVLLPFTDAMPLLFSVDDRKDWLSSKKLFELLELADKSQELWFDYFKVTKEILKPEINDASLLNPIGLSREEVRARERQLLSVKLGKERANRGSKR